LVDPFTAIGLATAAFNGIKSAINTGKDIQSMTSQLGQWGKAISDLDFAHAKAEKPPWYKALGGGVEANAMEIWSHKQKAKEMREEMRQYISLYYGPSAWDEIVRMEVQMRKEQREAVYAAEEKKEAIINTIVVIIVVAIAASILASVIYMLGTTQGKW
jgi:hypothetical protein|tara:strand:- start:4565 stop:5041 length:477 start_codon:yes stop_codon:yes gene_type:complete